jgi:GT2 family glycosyltransferase
LDSDDTWHTEFLEVMSSALDTNPDAGIAYCGWQNAGLGSGRDEPFIPPGYENDHKIESLLGGCRWPIHGALVRSSIIRDAGGFDESLSSCMDYDLWLRIGTLHRLVRAPRILAYYHHHGGKQITRDPARIALNHRRAQQKFLQANPAVIGSLGKHRIRQLTAGELMRRGYESYWRRDLAAARKIFRVVMKQGYGNFNDWTHMLPAWLPESWHRWLLSHRGHANHTAV